MTISKTEHKFMILTMGSIIIAVESKLEEETVFSDEYIIEYCENESIFKGRKIELGIEDLNTTNPKWFDQNPIP